MWEVHIRFKICPIKQHSHLAPKSANPICLSVRTMPYPCIHYIICFAKPSPMPSLPLPTNIPPSSYPAKTTCKALITHQCMLVSHNDFELFRNPSSELLLSNCKNWNNFAFSSKLYFQFLLFCTQLDKKPTKTFSVQYDWAATFCYLFTFFDNTNFLLVGKEKSMCVKYGYSHDLLFFTYLSNYL